MDFDFTPMILWRLPEEYRHLPTRLTWTKSDLNKIPNFIPLKHRTALQLQFLLTPKGRNLRKTAWVQRGSQWIYLQNGTTWRIEFNHVFAVRTHMFTNTIIHWLLLHCCAKTWSWRTAAHGSWHLMMIACLISGWNQCWRKNQMDISNSNSIFPLSIYRGSTSISSPWSTFGNVSKALHGGYNHWTRLHVWT